MLLWIYTQVNFLGSQASSRYTIDKSTGLYHWKCEDGISEGWETTHSMSQEKQQKDFVRNYFFQLKSRQLNSALSLQITSLDFILQAHNYLLLNVMQRKCIDFSITGIFIFGINKTINAWMIIRPNLMNLHGSAKISTMPWFKTCVY